MSLLDTALLVALSAETTYLVTVTTISRRIAQAEMRYILGRKRDESKSSTTETKPSSYL